MLKNFLDRLLGKPPEWDGTDRRETLRAKVDFELEVSCPSARYLGVAKDAGPKGVLLRIRGPWVPKLLKRGQPANLKYLTPMFDTEIDTIKGKIQWAKKEADNLFLLAVAFDDSLENLKKSWVRIVLKKGLQKQVRQQRKQLRVRANVPARFRVGGQEIEGKLRDISMGGARLETFKAFAVGSHMTVSFGAGKGTQMTLRAFVRRAEQQLGTFNYGLAFILDEAQAKELLGFIKNAVEIRNKNAL